MPMTTVTLASLNTHYGVRPSRRPPADPYDLEATIAAFDTDVVVLQEVWRPDARRGRVDTAAADLGYALEYVATGSATTDTRWPRLTRHDSGESGIAVLSRLPVRRLAEPIVGPTPGDPAPARRALDVELTTPGGPLRLVAVHLTSRLPHGPPMQLRRLAAALPPAGAPAVVAGDFNFWGPGVERLLPGWRRTVRGRTWPARSPHSQIDHVLVRPRSLEVVRAEVLGDVGSDHRPVRVELALDGH
jgi:endonuclease/exonuclease/phosphatase family metal-dependent hydrolase